VEAEVTSLVNVLLEIATVQLAINVGNQVTLPVTAIPQSKRLEACATTVEAEATLPENAATMPIPIASDVAPADIWQEIALKSE
jgi:hypothetical protein